MSTKVQPLTASPAAAPAISLSKDEILRYSRRLVMPEVGMEGQLKLKTAKVLLVGTGGLGAPLGLVSHSGRNRTNRPRRFRCRRFHQSAAPGDSRHQGRWQAKKGIRRAKHHDRISIRI